MLTYHGDPAIKAKYIARFAEHRAADAVIQGVGYENGRGCFIGCTLQTYDHARFPIELGWPLWLAFLADAIFEGLPQSEAAQFGTDLLDAVPVGVTLDAVYHRISAARMTRLLRLKSVSENNLVYAAVQRVHDLHVAESIDSVAWEAARAAARAAAKDVAKDVALAAARAAALAAASDAAWDDAAMATAWAAVWDAATAAARAAAWDAARDATMDAAWDATRDAAWDATWNAAFDAAWDVERAELLLALRSM